MGPDNYTQNILSNDLMLLNCFPGSHRHLGFLDPLPFPFPSRRWGGPLVGIGSVRRPAVVNVLQGNLETLGDAEEVVELVLGQTDPAPVDELQDEGEVPGGKDFSKL